MYDNASQNQPNNNIKKIIDLINLSCALPYVIVLGLLLFFFVTIVVLIQIILFLIFPLCFPLTCKCLYIATHDITNNIN